MHRSQTATTSNMKQMNMKYNSASIQHTIQHTISFWQRYGQRYGQRHITYYITSNTTPQHQTSGVPTRGLGGLEPLPLPYDLRSKRVRMRQNMVFSAKNTKNFMGMGTLPDPSPVGTGIPSPYAPPPRRLQHLNPSHSKILGTPLHQRRSITTGD